MATCGHRGDPREFETEEPGQREQPGLSGRNVRSPDIDVEPQVEGEVTKPKPSYHERLHVVTCRAALDAGREAVLFVSRLLAAERRARRTPKASRALTCFNEAVLVLRHYRDGTSPADLAADHGIGRSTAYRYSAEGTGVLTAQAPDLHRALDRARQEETSHLVRDGTVIPTDRCGEKSLSVKGEQIDRWYSGKAHHHGGNLRGVMEPDGSPLFISDIRPGSVHDLPAAAPTCSVRSTPQLPNKQPNDGATLALDNRALNRLQRGMRCLAERGFAPLTQRWRLLQHITASPSKIGTISRAALVLTHFEHGRLT